ncbi:M55 family metallopeptidase [Sulfitobacter sp. R18_1]|uniref:M55 family metallopeptidase n=1 Tax=Sulfitobacter sp. R18_1 TaxID=2821104 RepID=UPI001ADB6B64|nr:M55 family metallopeptidase [Sulfitobacter sp. R18_1]MBO9429646.1 M55 family metallopeptidase [Sulfitobacter sp. R18_1]
MKIFISVDIEGIAGVSEQLQGQRGNPEYEVARRLMTQEANAAIAGAFDGGATSVTVADSHGPMRNMIAEELDYRAELVSGKPRPLSMIQGLTEAYSGVVLIGYHGAAGEFGVLAHTISGLAFAEIRMNGEVVGEPTLFAGYATEIGVPLLAASGDDHLCKEIAHQFPHAIQITTKTALGAHASKSLSPAVSRKRIQEAVTKAVQTADDTNLSQPCTPPLTVEVRMMRQLYADAAALLPQIERLSANHIRFTAVNHTEAIGTLSALALMASAL